MSWQEEYKSKLISMTEAVSLVQSGGQRLHLSVQVGLAFEADAGQVGQRHVAVVDPHPIGKASEGLEQVGVRLIAAQAQARGDVQ